jgi:tetratricopeptide (TPR) repeat protein
MKTQSRLIVGLGALVVLALPLAARGADSSLERGESLARSGRCTEALPVLAQARKADPSSARASFVAGQCQIQTKQYADAVASLEAAKKAPGTPAETDLYLGMARFHLGDLDGAERALADARTTSPGRPELDFYEGLVLLSRAKSRDAAAALERSRLSGAERLEPLASYYEGLAWQGADERAKAKTALRRVVDTAPGTVWAEAAQRMLEGRGTEGDPSDASRVFLEAEGTDRGVRGLMGDEPPRQWASLTVGGEWDSNVVLRGGGVRLPQDISNESDGRFVWSVEGGATLWKNDDWTLGFAGFYYGTVHGTLNEFDTHFPSLSTWLDRRLTDRDALRLQYDFGYAWIGGEPYWAVQNLMPAYYHDWGQLGTTRLFAQGTWSSYFPDDVDVPGPALVGAPCPDPLGLCGPVGLDEAHDRNRDGWGAAAGVDHAVLLNIPHVPTWIRAGYRFNYYWSRGSEYDYSGHEFRLGFRSELPYLFALDTWGSFTYQPYRNPSTFPDPNTLVAGRPYTLSGEKRSDDIVQFQVSLERPITDWLLASVRYTWIQDTSNVNVYDYDRQIIGGFLTFRYAR